LPLGGAKATIFGDPCMALEEKHRLLVTFANAMLPLLKTGYYVPSGDLGTTDDDIRSMLASVGVKIPSRSLDGRSSYHTGQTVVTSARIAGQHLGLDLAHASVAIEGFGKVGTAVAREFHDSGSRVVAISTSLGALYNENGLDVVELIRLQSEAGDAVVRLVPEGEKIELRDLLESPVDVLSPCASPHSINGGNAKHVLAKLVIPGANAAITAEAEQILHQRGVISVPDFVASCGGVLGASMAVIGLGEYTIRRFIRRAFARKVAATIKAAERQGIILSEYAQKEAQESFNRIKARVEGDSAQSKVLNFGIKLYRKRLMPQFVGHLIGPTYFRHILALERQR